MNRIDLNSPLNRWSLVFKDDSLESDYRGQRTKESAYYFVWMIGAMMFVNFAFTGVEYFRSDDALKAVFTRVIFEVILVLIFILGIGFRRKRPEPAVYDGLFILSSTTAYIFILIADFVGQGLYILQLPNTMLVLLFINASSIGPRFPIAVLVNFSFLMVYCGYVFLGDVNPLLRSQFASLCVYLSLASVLGYILERQSRSLYLNMRLLAEKNRIIEEQNEQKNRLISLLTHDIRDPLGTLNGILQLKTEKQISAEEALEFFGEVSERVTEVIEFTNRTLEWIREQMKGVEIKIAPVLVKPIVEEISQIYAANFKKKEIVLIDEIPESLTIHADTDILNIVFRNLIQNALKYSPENGRIWVTYRSSRNSHFFSVKDMGTGIEPHEMEGLFEFKMDSRKGSMDEVGTGLGLSLCYKLIRKIGGTIQVVNNDNIGCTFIVQIPNDLETNSPQISSQNET